MSALIKGMEMPKDGCHHIICIYADGTVATGIREYRAIPVPEPHGRLIDADEAAKYIWELLGSPSNLANAQWFIDALREMPTIIPPEEE